MESNKIILPPAAFTFLETQQNELPLLNFNCREE